MLFGGILTLSNPSWHLADLIEEVTELSKALKVSFHHIRCTAHDKADFLAKEGAHRPNLFVSVQL